jgi:hypothetical protein
MGVFAVVNPMKVSQLVLALACFAAGTVILVFATDAVGYGLSAYQFASSGLMVWQGRLWK